MSRPVQRDIRPPRYDPSHVFDGRILEAATWRHDCAFRELAAALE